MTRVFAWCAFAPLTAHGKFASETPDGSQASPDGL